MRLRNRALGRSSMKSANTGESPTGYRSRGPSALRQARRLARIGPELRRRAREDERRISDLVEKRRDRQSQRHSDN